MSSYLVKFQSCHLVLAVEEAHGVVNCAVGNASTSSEDFMKQPEQVETIFSHD